MKKLISLKLFRDKKLESKYSDIRALYVNNCYTFKIDGIKTSVSNKIFTRESNEFKFTLDLEKREALYLLKDNNMLFDIDVLELTSKFSDNNIILEYRLSSDEAIIRVEISIEGEINE